MRQLGEIQFRGKVKIKFKPKTQALEREPGAPSAFLRVTEVGIIALRLGSTRYVKIRFKFKFKRKIKVNRKTQALGTEPGAPSGLL